MVNELHKGKHVCFVYFQDISFFVSVQFIDTCPFGYAWKILYFVSQIHSDYIFVPLVPFCTEDSLTKSFFDKRETLLGSQTKANGTKNNKTKPFLQFLRVIDGCHYWKFLNKRY